MIEKESTTDILQYIRNQLSKIALQMADEDKSIGIPRNLRTSTTEAMYALSRVCNTFTEAVGESIKNSNNDLKGLFYKGIVRGRLDALNPNGDEELQSFISDVENNPEKASEIGVISLIIIATSYAVQAIKSKENSPEAWGYASSANYWAGFLNAISLGDQEITDAAANLAKKRHAENYALAATALKYWEEHIDPNKSAQAAANELLSVVPLSHKKLASIVAGAKKAAKNN